MLRHKSIRSSVLLGTFVLGLTAVVASASAAAPVWIVLAVSPSMTALHQPVTVNATATDPGSWVSREPLTVQFKECGRSPTRFRDVAELPPPQLTDPVNGKSDGNWTAVITPLANGTFRGTIGPSVKSNEVSVLTRAHVRLAPTKRGRYRAEVEARLPFRGKSVQIERYDRGRSSWVPLRTVVLNRTDRVKAEGVPYVWTRSVDFTPKVPAGTKLRAVLPLSQAKPCYAAGSSEVLQT